MTIAESIAQEVWTFAAQSEPLTDAVRREVEDLWPYRPRTIAILRRYGRTSIELGRLPSILGREFFRSRVTSKAMRGFEDVIVFVTDMERALKEIDSLSQRLLAMYVLEEYTLLEISGRIGCSERTAERLIHESIDCFSRVLLTKRLITGLPHAEWVS